MIVTIDAVIGHMSVISYYKNHGFEMTAEDIGAGATIPVIAIMPAPVVREDFYQEAQKIGTARNFYVQGEEIKAEVTIQEQYSDYTFSTVKSPSYEWIVAAYKPRQQ